MWTHTNRVALRAIHPMDYKILYDIVASGEVGWRYRFRGATPSPESFPTLLWEDVLAQYVVADHGSEKLLGLVSLYGYNFRGRHVYLSALADPSVQGSGLLVEGALALVDHAFRTWELHKIYIETLEFNLSQFASIAQYLDEEGRLESHEWADGAWWDLLTFALYRHTWEAHRERFCSALGVEGVALVRR